MIFVVTGVDGDQSDRCHRPGVAKPFAPDRLEDGRCEETASCCPHLRRAKIAGGLGLQLEMMLWIGENVLSEFVVVAFNLTEGDFKRPLIRPHLEGCGWPLSTCLGGATSNEREGQILESPTWCSPLGVAHYRQPHIIVLRAEMHPPVSTAKSVAFRSLFSRSMGVEWRNANAKKP